MGATKTNAGQVPHPLTGYSLSLLATFGRADQDPNNPRSAKPVLIRGETAHMDTGVPMVVTLIGNPWPLWQIRFPDDSARRAHGTTLAGRKPRPA
jgi:hypothetical protein